MIEQANAYTYYLSLGSNEGNKKATLQQACALLEKRCGRVEQTSDYYRSMPQGYESDKEYLNCCVKVVGRLSPEELLLQTQQIERDLGRTRKTTWQDGKPNYHDRPIDIDILLAYQAAKPLQINTTDLCLPHPRMQTRPFVMVPLRQIWTD